MRQCPACQVPLSPAQFGEVTVDGCHRCGGVWFHRGELTALAGGDGSRLAALDRAFEGEPAITPPDSQRHTCPRCHSALVHTPTPAGAALDLLLCPAGHGFWLREKGFAAILHELNATQREILEGEDALCRRFDTLLTLIRRLGGRLDKRRLSMARTGLAHLRQAIEATAETVREEELRLAEMEFEGVLEPDAEEEAGEGSVELGSRLLIALGYWGKFHCYTLCGATQWAAIQVYECTERFPLVGIRMFPREFFRKEYAALIDQIETEIAAMLRRHAAASPNSSYSFWAGLFEWMQYVLVDLFTEAAGYVALRGFVEHVLASLELDLSSAENEIERLAKEAARESERHREQLQGTLSRQYAEVIPAAMPHGTGTEPAPVEE